MKCGENWALINELDCRIIKSNEVQNYKELQTPRYFSMLRKITLKLENEIPNNHESDLAMTCGKDRRPECPLTNEWELKMRLK